MNLTEQIKQRTTLITHDRCPDGLASAMIVAAALPQIEIEFHTHGSPEYEALEAKPGMLFVDFSPPRDRIEEFKKAGTIVLDHHKGAQDVVEAFGDWGIFADEEAEPGVCGAVLAYRHVWGPIIPTTGHEEWDQSVLNFAILAGIRDTWQKGSPLWDEACAQAATLMFLDRDRLLQRSRSVGKCYLSESETAIGTTLLAARARTVEQVQLWTFKILPDPAGDPMTVGVFNDSTGLISDVAEYHRSKGVDVCVGFRIFIVDGLTKITYSLRSNGRFDCAGFAKTKGGGGHTRAAGYTIDFDGGGTTNPFTRFVLDNSQRLLMDAAAGVSPRKMESLTVDMTGSFAPSADR